MSVVRKGKDNKTGHDVAIKILKKQDIAKQHQASLHNEIEILTRVSHPHIIALEEILDTGPELYLVMELATGGQLFDRITDKGSYTESDARKVIKNIVEAVKYLHSHGIVHRDLKPDNLLLKSTDDDYSVKIADFGLSKIIAEEQMMLTACGSPSYVAPEVVLATGYGKPVDMWAVGLIAYILLCGFPPFVGDSVAELLEKIMSAKVDYPVEYWSVVSNDAKDFVYRLLVADPDTRLTAEAALKHPWLSKDDTKDGSKTDDNAEGLSVQENMKNTVRDWRLATKK